MGKLSVSRRGSMAILGAAVLDQLDVTAAHVVGTAAGAMVAAQFAVAFPKRVRTLTLASSLVAVADPDFMSRVATLTPPGWWSLPSEFRELGPSFRLANPK